MLKEKSNIINVVGFVDISYSWGPAIHFVEVWNEYSLLSNYKLIGYGILEKNKRPYTKLFFSFTPMIIKNRTSKVVRRIKKTVYDIYLFGLFMFCKKTIIYIRKSSFGIFMLLALYLRNHRLFIEVNGLAKEDQVNQINKNNIYRIAFFKLMEWLYLKLPNASIISVSKNISSILKRRYKIKKVFTISNGCSQRLLDIFESRRPLINNSINIGYLGTFTPWDGHEKTDELYEACKNLDRSIKFHIAGTDVKNTILYKKYATNKDFTFYDSIHYHDLAKFYKKLDAAYVFYRFDRHKNVEVSPLKVLEYWASKIPILCTAIKGTEFIKNYNIGYLIKESEYSDKVKFNRAVEKFFGSIDKYVNNYQIAPKPRTWKDVAQNTKLLIET